MLLVGGAWWLACNVADNIASRGLRTGFGFLDQRAGFKITPTLIDFDESGTFGRAFLAGLLNTLLVAGLAIPAASILGLAIGVARMSPSLIGRAAGFYVETFRNIPPLVLLFFIYGVVLRALPLPRQSWSLGDLVFINNRGLSLPVPAEPTLLLALLLAFAMGLGAWRKLRGRWGGAGLLPVLLPVAAFVLVAPFCAWDVPALRGFNFSGGGTLTPEFLALFLALGLYQAAYVAETVRAGLMGVPHGQMEAARALGLGRLQILRLVILPQAMRIMLPPLTTIYVSIVKGSSIAAAIGYPDLVAVFAGTALNIIGQAIEIMLITGAVYLSLGLGLAGAMMLYERHLARRWTP